MSTGESVGTRDIFIYTFRTVAAHVQATLCFVVSALLKKKLGFRG